MATELPTGTVTFLFTDIEGSTRMLQEFGGGYGEAQEEHAAVMRTAIASSGGVEIRTEGDSFFVVFPSAEGAFRAAVSAQRGLSARERPDEVLLRVRMGMHTGEGVLGGDDYVVIDGLPSDFPPPKTPRMLLAIENRTLKRPKGRAPIDPGGMQFPTLKRWATIASPSGTKT